MTEPTPSLDEFRKAYEADDNLWWMLQSGDHMNLFDQALERIDELEAEWDRSRADAGRAHGNAGALHARVMELLAQVSARDARIAELEAAQRPPLGYVVLRGDFDYEDIQLIDQRVWSDLEIAGDAADRTGGAAYELREVQS